MDTQADGDSAMICFTIFRPARDASPLWNIFKTAIQIILFWSTFLVVFPLIIHRLESGLGLAGWRFTCVVSQVLGGLMLAGFSIVGLWSGYVMSATGGGTPLPVDCACRLVIRGPYAFVRNPMAAAGIGQGIAVGIILGSPAVIAYALVGAVVWHYGARPAEERDLEERFGEEYRQYRSSVGLWWPRW